MSVRLRELGLLLGVLLALLSESGGARAEPTLLEAGISCTKIATPGRILCEVRANAARARLVWADALVVSAPAFARPLRSRVGLELAPGGATASAKLALVGAAPGKGELRIAVRGVVCTSAPSGELCRPAEQRVVTEVEVGIPVPAPAPSSSPAP